MRSSYREAVSEKNKKKKKKKGPGACAGGGTERSVLEESVNGVFFLFLFVAGLECPARERVFCEPA